MTPKELQRIGECRECIRLDRKEKDMLRGFFLSLGIVMLLALANEEYGRYVDPDYDLRRQQERLEGEMKGDCESDFNFNLSKKSPHQRLEDFDRCMQEVEEASRLFFLKQKREG